MLAVIRKRHYQAASNTMHPSIGGSELILTILTIFTLSQILIVDQRLLQEYITPKIFVSNNYWLRKDYPQPIPLTCLAESAISPIEK
jgi:hypothetical protein